jgi:hypothetical protein
MVSSTLRAVDRLLASPARFCAAMFAVTIVGLGLDRFADLRGQLLLGAATWGILLLACRPLTAEERAQVAVVVMVATCAEVIGSVIWRVYEYRLENLPLFVPPGHGLVYLCGLMIARSAVGRGGGRLLVGAALAGALGWAVAGLTVLPRLDVAGAVGAATFAVFLLRGRAPAIYAGVFFAVATLEIYGTAIGTWTWRAEIPGLGVPDGNPPSGAVSGYVLFDICALALAPALLALCARAAGPWRRRYCRPAPAPALLVARLDES